MKLHKVSKAEFDSVLFDTHSLVFGDEIPEEYFRYDFALFTELNGEPVSYTIVKERTSESAEMCFGGTVTDKRGIASKDSMTIFLATLCEQYKYVYCQTKNDNFPMLRLALSFGGKIVGVHQNFRNDMFVTFEFKKGDN